MIEPDKSQESDNPPKTVGGKILDFLDQSKHILAASSLIGVLLSLAVWVVGKRQYHIIVWKEADNVLYPSDLTNDYPLPLSLDSIDAKAASFVLLDITNNGNRHLGTERELWQIHVSAPEAEKVAVVGKLKTEPRRLVASVLPKQKPNEITINLGILEPEDHVWLSLLLINDKSPGYSRLSATSNFKAVLIETTSASPQERLAMKMYWPITILTFLVCVVLVVNERQQKKKVNAPKVPALVPQILISLFFSPILGYIVASGIAWIILLIV